MTIFFKICIVGSSKAGGQGRNGFNAGETSVGRVAVLEGGDDGGVGLDGVSDARSLCRCYFGNLGRTAALIGMVTAFG